MMCRKYLFRQLAALDAGSYPGTYRLQLQVRRFGTFLGKWGGERGQVAELRAGSEQSP